MSLLGADYNAFQSDEIAKPKAFAARIQSNGDLNMGTNKIIMQGSSINDDGSQGGGLILRGGANRIHQHGSLLIDGNYEVRSGVVN